MSLPSTDLTQQQINEFIRKGVLVVPNVLSKSEVDTAICSLNQSLLKYGVDHRDLRGTAQNLNKLSTTGGAGGIIDLFYEKWRLDLATNPKIFRIVSTLWANTWGSEFHDLHQDDNNAVDSSVISQIDGLIQCVDSYLMNSLDRSANTTNDVDLIRSLYSHPFGSLDRLHDGLPSGFVYMNRVCYRVSDQISDLHSRGKKKRRKLQRCLAPHLDSCPHDLFGLQRDALNVTEMKRWRPIQVFVALTENHRAETGGFECVEGFHQKYNEYFKHKSTMNRDGMTGNDTVCVGDFCRLLPKEDGHILSKFEHIEYAAGSLVLFDWRIPHANARSNTSGTTRIVVYTGFLPNVELNRKYCRKQLERYYDLSAPPDFWGKDNYSKNSENRSAVLAMQSDGKYKFSKLGEKLMGITPWT